MKQALDPGHLHTALAYFIGCNGEIYSYEMRTQMQANARKNLSRFNLLGRVLLKTKDIADGFDETDVDAIFLDLPNPFDYIEKVRESLKTGGHFGCILPSANQVCKLLAVLKTHDFAFIDVAEILLRHYKDDPERFRPVDRMVAHTGFLIFARPVIINHE